MSGSKQDLYLFQFGELFGNEIYLPYSIGMVWAYARSFPLIADNIANRGFVFVREDPALIVSRLDSPDIAAFSTYIWNWEMSIAVAKEIKRQHPDCLTVFGGAQVPDPSQMGDFFEVYPCVDIIVHGEGEISFAEILRQCVTERDFTSVAGITYRGVSTDPRPRSRDLSIFPSPYLTGVFEDLFELPYKYHVVWESNRGCPYGCTFCDWGSMTMQKLHNFVEDRLHKEIEYFGEKQISHVFMADANFGIIKRDVDIARYLAAVKAKTGGFPTKLRVNYAKNNPDRVFEIAKILNEEELDKGITLSVQTMDPDTLKIIKRKNLKYNTLSSFIRRYQAEGIYTYTEVIVGLPGETYDSFKDGIDQLFDASAHDSVWIYRCSLLPNAPMNEPDYRRQHKIRTIRTPIFLNHTEPDSDPVQEYEETVIETATLSFEKYKDTLALAWALQTFHSLNLTQVIAIYARVYKNLKYTDFYEEMLEYARNNPDSIVGKELDLTTTMIDNVLENDGSWDNVVPEFLPLNWATEEASYLRIALEREQFYLEFEMFLNDLDRRGILTIDACVLRDLVAYQKAIIVKWGRDESETLDLAYSVHRFHRDALTGEPCELESGSYRVRITDPYNFNGDKARYATEILFWGRRSGKVIYKDIEELEGVRALDLRYAY